MKKQNRKTTSGIKRCLTRKYKEMTKGIDLLPEPNNSHSKCCFEIFSLYDNSKYETQTSCCFNPINF